MLETVCVTLFLSSDSGALLMCDLNEVASVIVNRAWEDPTYHKAAANLCAYIMRVSQITLPALLQINVSIQ